MMFFFLLKVAVLYVGQSFLLIFVFPLEQTKCMLNANETKTSNSKKAFCAN